jgi:hypothetical protein
MKLLLENWRNLLEGNVIQFPRQPKISEDDLQRVITFEDALADLLADIYGNQSEIPIEAFERMEELVISVEESLIK